MNVKTDAVNVAVKPATLLKEDFIHDLTDLCNNCSLPLFVIEYILNDFIRDVRVASKRQLELDKENYKKELNELQTCYSLKNTSE